MKKNPLICMLAWLILVSPAALFAQGIGEYGRAVGSVPRGKGVTGSPFGQGSHGSGGSAGVGDVSGRAMPKRLVVAKTTGLFPRQDEETETIAVLAEGDALVPMVQSEGGSAWFMVKTAKGLVGWVKSSDVKQEAEKK